jgi:hypothetical protein
VDGRKDKGHCLNEFPRFAPLRACVREGIKSLPHASKAV